MHLQSIEKVVYAMAGLRMMSAMVELCGALLMLYYGTAARALQVNGLLAMVGPSVLVIVTIIGVSGLADDINWGRLMIVFFGVACILYGTQG